MQPSAPALLLVVLATAAAPDDAWTPDGDSAPAEGSGGRWEDDEDILPLSPEQRLADAARFRDELLWDAEREAERARAEPTKPLQPLPDGGKDGNSDGSSSSISSGGSSGGSGRKRGGGDSAAPRSSATGGSAYAQGSVQGDAEEAMEEAKAAAGARSVVGLMASRRNRMRDDLYFQEAGDIGDLHHNPSSGGSEGVHASENDQGGGSGDGEYDGASNGGTFAKVHTHFDFDTTSSTTFTTSSTMSTPTPPVLDVRASATAPPVTSGNPAANTVGGDEAPQPGSNASAVRDAVVETATRAQGVTRVLVQGVLVTAGDKANEAGRGSVANVTDSPGEGSRQALAYGEVTAAVNSSSRPFQHDRLQTTTEPGTGAKTSHGSTRGNVAADSVDVVVSENVDEVEATAGGPPSDTKPAPSADGGEDIVKEPDYEQIKSDAFNSSIRNSPLTEDSSNMSGVMTDAADNAPAIGRAEPAFNSTSANSTLPVVINATLASDSATPDAISSSAPTTTSRPEAAAASRAPAGDEGSADGRAGASNTPPPASGDGTAAPTERSRGWNGTTPAPVAPPALAVGHSEAGSAATEGLVGDSGTARMLQKDEDATVTPIAIPPTPPTTSSGTAAALTHTNISTSTLNHSKPAPAASIPSTTPPPSPPPASLRITSSAAPSRQQLSGPRQAASLARPPALSPCQRQCRALLSQLRLQVEPPRLLVAAGAAVSIQCLLPSLPGALADLRWTFRPTSGAECGLTAVGRRPRCGGFGNAAQMYFVNQTLTSTTLAIPRVTAALGGHYTCTAEVRCCPRSRQPPAARFLSTYIHVYGARQTSSYWAVSAAVCVCLAAGLAAALALRRRCARRAKRPPSARCHYRPVRRTRFASIGEADDEDEWARLYTAPAAAADEGGRLAAAGQQPHRQRTDGAAKTRETALDATCDCNDDEDDDAGETKTARLGEAFAGLPETHIARRHAPRPAHIHANPLASPQFRAVGQPSCPESGAVVSPRYEIPLTPPDAPPTPPRPPTAPLWRLGAAARK